MANPNHDTLNRSVYSIVLLLLILLVLIPPANGESLNNNTTILSDLLPSGPINITDEQDFIDQGWPGDGTYEDPFRIEGLVIESTNDTPCIQIRNTNETHWIISDCMITGSLSEGIRLWKSGYGKILNSIITGCMNGVDAVLSGHLQICDCRIWNCSDTGILVYSRSTDIMNNVVNQSTEGSDAISFTGPSEPIPGSDANLIRGNLIYGSISIGVAGIHIIDNDIFPISRSDSIIITIDGVDLDTNRIYSSFNLAYSKSTYISGCTFQSYLDLNGGVIIREKAANTTFRSCTFNGIGIQVGHSVTPANVTIRDCIFDSHGQREEAILFTRDVDGEIRIRDCEISNYRYGVSIWESNVTGIISDSLFQYCYKGVQVESNNFTIVSNTFRYNEEGLRISGNSCIIHHNRFACNTRDAYDSGEGNTWDDGVSIGNWWQRYEGEGVFEIPGSAGSTDRYPHFYDYPCMFSTVTTTDTITTDDGLFPGGLEIGLVMVLVVAIVLVIVYTRKR